MEVETLKSIDEDAILMLKISERTLDCAAALNQGRLKNTIVSGINTIQADLLILSNILFELQCPDADVNSILDQFQAQDN